MISWALRRVLAARARKVRAALDDPRAAQSQAFAQLQRKLRGTAIARQTGFDRCRSLDDCKSLASIDCSPLLQRVYATGEPLFGARPLGFAQTSGTSGAPKYLPLTRASLASLDRALFDTIACHLPAHGPLFAGKHLMVGSRPRCGTAPCGLPVHDLAGLAATRAPAPFRGFQIPRHRDLFLESWDEKAARILAQSRGQQIVTVSGLPALVRDLARRGLRLPDLLRFVYGGAALSQEEQEELRALLGNDRFEFIETYFSSEAPLGFSLRGAGLALTLRDNLFLFRSGDDFSLADELQAGKSYSLYVTTQGGLIHYPMGDLIEVIETHPLLVRFAGREHEELSMTGEKVSRGQIEAALRALQLSAHLSAVWIEGRGLVWGLPAAIDPALLDDALCRINPLYEEALRRERVIEPSRAVVIAAERFERYRQGQRKPKRLFKSLTEVRAARLMDDSGEA